jgi:hypothetical protein
MSIKMDGQVEAERSKYRALVDADRQVFEAAILAFMMYSLLEVLTTDGKWNVNPQIMVALNAAQMAPFAKERISDERAQLIATRMDMVARDLLRQADPDDDLSTAVVAVARLCLRLADEGRVEPRSQAVLVSLNIMQEVTEDADNEWGYVKGRGAKMTDKMYARIRLEGYFNTRQMSPNTA